ncbi:MAG: matrixin family metalloprotease [Opitutaceae bacterium]
MPRPPLRIALLAASAFLAVENARAFDLLGSSWADGSIVMHLQLGPPAAPLIDGSPDWATVAESALAEWNQIINRSQFIVVRDSTATISRSNRINNVIFRTDVYGQAFDTRTLAVTTGSTSTATGRTLEKDVIFNSNRAWSSYRGNLRTGISEFRRVALHEFGHVLGLDHPDQAVPAQFVSAVMNSTITSNTENLRADDIAGARALYDANGPSAIPSIAAHPQSRTLQVGDSYTFSVTVNGAGPLTYTWTFRAAAAFSSETFRLATGPSYTIGSVQPADAGTYRVNVSGPGGVVASNTATLSVTPVTTSSDTLLANLSTRGVVDSGNGVLIAGIAVGGTTPKNVLIRAAGPALTDFGVDGALADPVLEIVGSNGHVVAQNDNWEAAESVAISAASTRLGAFQFKPGSRDAAALVLLPPGNYTAVVSGNANTSGVALVEAYDADADVSTSRTRKFVNIATRGQVSSGENVLIAGLVVTGPGPRTYLIRAVGPTLGSATFNVSGALSDPFLQIHEEETLLRENDDWDSPLSGQSALRDAAARVGAFSLQSLRDSAMIVTLRPGSYTAKVSGFESATGVALVEIYELPD